MIPRSEVADIRRDMARESRGSRQGANEHVTSVETVEGFGVETCEKCGETAHIGRMSDTCEGRWRNVCSMCESKIRDRKHLED